MKRKKKNIALVIDYLDSEYHVQLLTGIRKKALELDVNIINFVGGGILEDTNERVTNTVFNLIGEENTDGIMISSGTLSHFTSLKTVQELVSRYPHLPKVSLSLALEGIPSVVIDNTCGFRQLLLHLIDEHKYRRLAFIKGVDNNDDAKKRFAMYKEVLKEKGIPYDESLICQGEFLREKGYIAAVELLDNRGQKPEVIICANDESAWGVRERLLELGIKVPGEIALTGFDDSKISNFINPPLTTVRQPVQDVGAMGLEKLMDLINGEEVPSMSSLPTELVIRYSCGCFSEDVEKYRKPESNNGKIFSSPQMPDEEELLSRVVFTLFPDSNGREAVKRLIQSLLLDYKENSYTFPHTIELLFRDYVNQAEDMDFLRSTIIQLRDEILPVVKPKSSRHMENLFFKAMALFASNQKYRFGQNFLDIDKELMTFRDLSHTLVVVENINDLMTILAPDIGGLNIRFFAFSYFAEDCEMIIPKVPSQLVFAYDRDEGFLSGEKFDVFPVGQLVPSGVLPENRPFFLNIEPVFLGAKPIGLALFEFNTIKRVGYNIVLRLFINLALKSTVYTQKVQNQSLKIELANQELREALDSLKKAQEQLIQSEKMAALGGLVAGFAHEINTPLGISLTAASFLEQISDQIIHKYETGEMRKSDLEQYIKTSGESVEMVLSNLKRAHTMISSFKKISVDQSVEDKRLFPVKEYIQEILISLNPYIRKTNHRIDVECDPLLKISCYPGIFSQILTNFILNTLQHAFSGREFGVISIFAYEKDSRFYLIYRDNGKGISEENLKRIFEPFYTTSRNKGGTGLGLFIVFNFVTQRLGGTISVASKPGAGVSFTLSWPLG